MKKFWNAVQNKDTGENEIRIDGDIGASFWGWLFGLDEVTGKSFREDLKQFKGGDVSVWISSNGGSVYEASQIFTALKEHKGKVTVKIEKAISAASVIAMAGDEVLMSPTGVMMIHNPWTSAEGEAKDMEKALNTLNEVKETIMNAYQIKTGLSRKEISDLMDAETWMGAKKAMEKGFADGVLYEEDQTEDTYNGILKGAQVVFNSLQYVAPSKEEIESYKKELQDKQATSAGSPVDLYKAKQKNLERRLKHV